MAEHNRRHTVEERQRRVWIDVLGTYVVLALLIVAVVRATRDDPTMEVGYRVSVDTGSGTLTATAPAYASISWYNAEGFEERMPNVRLPWSQRFEMPTLASLIVRAQLAGSGTVRCEVWVDDELYQTQAATGSGATVACNAIYESPH